MAEALSLAWQARVLDWITSEEASVPNKHLVAQNYCNFYVSVRGLLPGISIVNFRYAYPEAALSNYGVGTAPCYDETGTLGHEDAASAQPGISCSPAGAFSITSTIPSAPDTRMARTPRQTAQAAAALHSASSFEF